MQLTCLAVICVITILSINISDVHAASEKSLSGKTIFVDHSNVTPIPPTDPKLSDITLSGRLEPGSKVTFSVVLKDPDHVVKKLHWYFGDGIEERYENIAQVDTNPYKVTHVYVDAGMKKVIVEAYSGQFGNSQIVGKSELSVDIKESVGPWWIAPIIATLIGIGGIITKVYMSKKSSKMSTEKK